MDRTDLYTEQDIQRGKGMSALSYLNFLWLIPLFTGAGKNPYVKFHMNQGGILFILWILVAAVERVLTFVLRANILPAYFGGIFLTAVNLAAGLLQVCLLVLTVIGLMNVISGRARELPLIGSVRIFK